MKYKINISLNDEETEEVKSFIDELLKKNTLPKVNMMLYGLEDRILLTEIKQEKKIPDMNLSRNIMVQDYTKQV